MPAIKKILVPTDFSKPSDDAVRYAASLGLLEHPEITVLHVYQLPAYFFPDGSVIASSPEMIVDLMRRIEASLQGAKAIAEAAGATRVQTLLVQGVAAPEIVRVATEGTYDLIAMGTHGHTGIAHALLGSVAQKVVRKAPCPVLTVRAQK